MAYSVSYGSTLPTTVTGNTYAIGFGFTGKGTGAPAGWRDTITAQVVNGVWIPAGFWIVSSNLMLSSTNQSKTTVYAGFIGS